ncbi:response regulator transcription factor [Sphingomonas sp.]|uniref:response regulator transcription factor n=1 Tax=Sphingomonas sp. TaxID=28214 RepID=UPI002B52F782|nr:response regulator transcription factor [Sphingomonas sp.]HWK36956.1 response regulator transcription factor [Sphingomonas sp.]
MAGAPYFVHAYPGPLFRGWCARRGRLCTGAGRQAISDHRQTRTVLIVEDVPGTRAWLTGLAGRAFPGAALASAATLAEARRWLAAQRAAGERSGDAVLALVDLGLPDGSGVDFIRDMLAALPGSRPVVATLFDSDDHLMAAMAAGAHGYLLKDHEPDDLVRRLRGMERGESPISPAMAQRILAHFRSHATFMTGQPAAPQLTARETDVLRLIGRGLKVAEAAGALGLSESTVSGYLKTIYRKLDIGTRAEAAVEAVRRGLV